MKHKLLSLLAVLLLAAGSLRAQSQAVKDSIMYSTLLSPFNGSLYFSSGVSAYGGELWKTNGTPATSSLVKEINPGPNGAAIGGDAAIVNNILYFTAYNPTYNTEIWKTDGTEAGTSLLKDLEPGSGTAKPTELTSWKGKLYFLSDEFNFLTSPIKLWVSNGTAEGTALLKDFSTTIPIGALGVEIRHLTPAGDNMYFEVLYAYSSGDYNLNYSSDLWKTDGTTTGTVLVKKIKSQNSGLLTRLIPINGTLYFYADDNTYGAELWKTDGTPTGTVLVKDVTPGAASTQFGSAVNLNGTLFFLAGNKGLWKSNGTSAGTLQVSPGNFYSLYSVGNKLYLGGYDPVLEFEPWVSDGTSSGTHLLKDINPSNSGNPGIELFSSNIVELNGIAYFIANDGVHGMELWKTDGTEAGTMLAEDLSVGAASTQFTKLAVFNNQIYFIAKPAGYSFPVLWKYTPSGSTLPTLVSTSPARNAVSAARNANLALTFSQAMNAATASSTAIKVYGSQTGLRSGSFSGGGTSTVTLDSAKDFQPGEEVSVSVTRNARNTSGNLLNKPQVFQFTAATAPAPAVFAEKAGPTATRATADVDGDGDVDLIVLGPATQQVSVQLNDGKGNFTQGANITLAQTPDLVAMADLDGDGDSDMAVTFSTGTFTPGGVAVYLNEGNGYFVNADSYPMPWRPTDIKAGDFDGDGHLDLAVPAPNPSSNDYDGTYVYGFVHILFNNGSAGFPRRTATLEAGEGNGGWDAGDVDGDGDLDLLGSTTNPNSGACLVYLNNGQGDFTLGQYLQAGRFPSGHLVDLDGDGDADVVSVDFGSPELGDRSWKLYLNNGTGSFAFEKSAFLGSYSSVGFTVGDFDGDGDADLAASKTDPNLDFGLGPDTLVVFVNNGSANFSVRKSPIRSGENRLYSADLDGDGDLDLIGGQRLFFNGGLPATSTVTLSGFAPLSAPVGAGVAIRGANFTAGSTVRFNGVAASQVSFESPTLLIATVPTGATSGPVQVSNANGTATSAGNLSVAAVTSLWQVKSAMSTARTQHGAVAISSNGRVYAFGGTNGSELSSLEIYNTNAFAWSAGAPIFTPTRGAAYVRGTDNQIYLFSGYGGGSNRSQGYKYNPLTNVWTALANIPVPVWAATAAASGNLIYMFGGQTAAGTASNAVQIYNTQTNSWTSGAVMPTALMQAQAVTSYNGKIYLFGGRTAAQGGLSDAVLVYNPATNAWSTAASMPVPKAQFGTVLNNDGRIFVVGGRGSFVPNQGPFFHTVEIFDPKTNSWSEGPALPSAVGGQTVVNSYGNLFMMGGIDGVYRNYNWRLVLPPVAPTSAKATAVSSSQIKVEWVDAAGNENRYEVERSLSAAGPWTVIATTAANASTHTDGSRVASTTYFYRIRGGNSSGYGAYSPTVSATTWTTGAAARESAEAEEATSLNLQAAPNPFHSLTTVTFTAQESGRTVLDLYDLQGQRLQQVFNAEVQAGESQKAEVNGSRLGQGLYLLRLVNGSKVQSLKVLIEK